MDGVGMGVAERVHDRFTGTDAGTTRAHGWCTGAR